MTKQNRADWITSKEAAAIISENSGHTVTDAYVRRLGILNKIETWQVDGRTKLYHKGQAEKYQVKAHKSEQKAKSA